MDNPTIIRTTQALGLTTALVSSGISFCAAGLCFPPILPLPISESSRILASLFYSGGKLVVPLTITSAVCNGVAGYLVPQAWREYTVAAILALSIPIYTRVWMMPGINKLLRVSQMDGSAIQGVRREHVLQLLQEWASQTYIRGALALGAGLLGVWVLARTQVVQEA
ncbi:hypothetical protein PV10_01093 [Exophiala mesophila]|uniref:DUF1772 domain-containing protein n=1 Tax=Exophiala mesophila TaxID=212818 RepID=A0A0D1Y9G9_EXOME|nr:uncharacterized protein PV10_01093 [Exophiala mesophila]KIV97331.1 hypothetical protein PV10_01093 [Exophiala mesophila]